MRKLDDIVYRMYKFVVGGGWEGCMGQQNTTLFPRRLLFIIGHK